jgi:hypothetical protein
MDLSSAPVISVFIRAVSLLQEIKITMLKNTKNILRNFIIHLFFLKQK